MKNSIKYTLMLLCFTASGLIGAIAHQSENLTKDDIKALDNIALFIHKYNETGIETDYRNLVDAGKQLIKQIKDTNNILHKLRSKVTPKERLVALKQNVAEIKSGIKNQLPKAANQRSSLELALKEKAIENMNKIDAILVEIEAEIDKREKALK